MTFKTVFPKGCVTDNLDEKLQELMEEIPFSSENEK
jgi:hypothetical protein